MIQETIRLADHVRSYPDFPVPGFDYRDITTLLNDPEAFREAIDSLAWQYQDREIDVIVGIEPNGYLFGAPLAYRLNVGLVVVRTLGNLPGETVEAENYLRCGNERLQLQRGVIQPGLRVVVVEDMLATGRTLRAACDLITQAGGVVAEVACLLELPALGGRKRLAGYPVFSLIQG